MANPFGLVTSGSGKLQKARICLESNFQKIVFPEELMGEEFFDRTQAH
jgi:hypothetical protein